MVPVFIGLQARRALRVAADDSALPDITKKMLLERIMGRLQTEEINRHQLCQIKSMTQDDMALSIELASGNAQTMVLSEQGKRWSLIIRKNSEENQMEFIIDTYRKINITFG